MDCRVLFPYPVDLPEHALRLSARARRLAAQADHTTTGLRAELSLLGDGWSGAAANACVAELSALARLAGSLSGPLAAAAHLLAEYHHELSHTREQIDRLRRRHEGEQALAPVCASPTAVDRGATDRPGSGSAADPSGQWEYDRIRSDLRHTVSRIAAQLQDLVSQLLPGSAGGRPSGVAVPAGAFVSTLPMLQAQRLLLTRGSRGMPARSAAPSVARSWWSLLTSDERARLVFTRPRRTGGLAGLPAAVRASANERALALLETRLEGLAVRSAQEERWLDNCRAVRSQLEIARRGLDAATSTSRVVQLLVFEPRAFGGDGRVAISVGDLDTADNVAFLVPGVGSDVRGSIPQLVTHSARLSRQSGSIESAEGSAVVAWLGYDAPALDLRASFPAPDEGGDLLAHDLAAVQAARAVLPHLTVIGHSFGSTVVGAALQEHRTAAAEAVLLGSPGAGVVDASRLRVGEGHVFVGASSRDPISYLGIFGPDPAQERFGALRFRAEDPTRNPWRMDRDDHSKYFRPSTESLSNLAQIVVGNRSAVTLAPYRVEVPLLPDGINADPETFREPSTVSTR